MSATRFLFIVATVAGVGLGDLRAAEPAPETPLDRLARVTNPLLRSGLALAGANTWLAGQPLPAEAPRLTPALGDRCIAPFFQSR